MDPNAIFDRLMRLARLDTTVFDEIRDDARETLPAILITVVGAFIAGLGTWLWWEVAWSFRPNNVIVDTFLLGSVFLALMYGVAILVAYVVLAQVYKVQADLQSMIRTCGYAGAVLVFVLPMLIPIIYPVFAIVPFAILLLLMIYAIQSATGADSNQVVISALAGFVVMVFVLGLIAAVTSSSNAPMGAGVFGIMYHPV